MLRSMVLALDGSPHSDAAVGLGIRWSRRFDALLVGLGVIDESAICTPVLVPIGGSSFKQQRDEVLLARARRRVEQTLERFAVRCTEAGVAHKPLQAVGTPFERIVAEAQQYDLIMVGQRTYFHPEIQSGPCDTLHSLIKDTPRPVVAVPEKLVEGRSVLIAYDGSLPAIRAVQAFQEMGLNGSYEVHVLSVDPDRAEAARRASKAVEFLRLHGVAARPHAIESSRSPARVIQDQVERLNASLLVMGTFGHSALREFLLGSVTRTVLKESTAPLFLYH